MLDSSQGLADSHEQLPLSDDGRELDGELFHINADGEQTLTCPVELERNAVTDPVYTPDGADADAG